MTLSILAIESLIVFDVHVCRCQTKKWFGGNLNVEKPDTKAKSRTRSYVTEDRLQVLKFKELYKLDSASMTPRCL